MSELSAAERAVADLPSLPRKNGELVFEAPWEGRIFGLAVALHDRQVYPWEAFRGRLIEEIGRADAAGETSSYYERWLASFERLLLETGLISRADLEVRTAAIASGAEDDH